MLSPALLFARLLLDDPFCLRLTDTLARVCLDCLYC